MTETVYESRFKRHNVQATFVERSLAQQAARKLKETLGRSDVKVRPDRGQAGLRFAEMRDEIEGMVAAPALGSAMNKSQAQGAVVGALVAGIVGVCLGVLGGILIAGAPGAEISVGRWLITWVLIPAAGAGTFGLLAGGMLKPRYAPAEKDEGVPEEAGSQHGVAEPAGEWLVSVHTDDEEEFHRALELLESEGADRLDRFDEQGQVLATRASGEGRSDAAGPAPGRTTSGE